MAYPPPSRPGSPEQGPLRHWKDASANSSLEHLAILLGQHGAGPASADIALDIVLNEIVEQARMATGATGAAVALARGGQYICRATTGRNAPDLGVVLNSGSGLSGACIQTAEMQFCDDTETDPRVDAAICRELGVRSVVVVPLLREGELLGIFEILSPFPQAFKDREIETLLLFCRRIIDCMSPAAPAVVEQVPPVLLPDVEETRPTETIPPFQNISETTLPEPPLFLQSPAKSNRPKDYWTPILTLAVMGFSLLLGWMLGHVGWQAATAGGAQALAATHPQQSARAANSPSIPNAANQSTSESKDPPADAAQTQTTRVVPAPASKPRPHSAGGLTVYENGKMVFQITPVPERRPGVEYASSKSMEATTEPAQLPPPVALSRLVERIEPHYPDAARQQHIQGPVVLHALVGKDGSVRELKSLSGNSQLVMAAADAVRQWRFKTYAPKGQPVEFETQITVEFKLP